MVDEEKAGGVQLNGHINGAAKVLTFIGMAGAAFIFLQNMAKTDQLQVEHNTQAIAALSLKVDKGEHDHAFSLAKAAAIAEKFTEVETQFKNLDERTVRIEARFTREIHAFDVTLHREIADSVKEYVRAAELLPRLAVVENYLLWLKRKIEITPPARVEVSPPSG